MRSLGCRQAFGIKNKIAKTPANHFFHILLAHISPQMIRVTITCLVCAIENHATVRSCVTWAAVPALSAGRQNRRMNGSRPPAGEPITRLPHSSSLTETGADLQIQG
jgi:hypothetical protein